MWGLGVGVSKGWCVQNTFFLGFDIKAINHGSAQFKGRINLFTKLYFVNRFDNFFSVLLV